MVSALTIGLFLYGVSHLSSDHDFHEPILRKEIIKVDGGFGYQIFSGDKLLIQQEFIPAVKGRKPFNSAKDARRVALLVIEKIRNRTNPRISLAEITDLDVVILDQQ